MNFNCVLCDYATNTSFDFNRHTKSLKHIKNTSLAIVDKYECSDCGTTFKYQTNLTRHKREICLKKNKNNAIELNVDEEIKKLKEELKKKDDIIKQNEDAEKERLLKELNQQKEEIKQKEIQYQLREKEHKKETHRLNDIIQKLNEKQITFLSSTVNKAGNLAAQTIKSNDKSFSLIKFLMQNYSEAPPLQSIPEDRYIELAEGKFSFAYTMIYYYRHNLLYKHFGDFIIGVIKKEEPSQNSIWIRDLSRRSFYIKSEIGKWISDKQGQKIDLIVFKPLFKHAIEMMTIYNSEQNKLSKNMKLSVSDMAEHNKNNNDGDKVLDYIKNKSVELGKDILNYIGEYFLYYEDGEKPNKEI